MTDSEYVGRLLERVQLERRVERQLRKAHDPWFGRRRKTAMNDRTKASVSRRAARGRTWKDTPH